MERPDSIEDERDELTVLALLEPDLIVLDIGLPTLNGIEVARQVRNLRPECKILFMSQVSSAGVAQEAKKPSTWGHWATLLKRTRGVNSYPLWRRFVKDGSFVSKGPPSSNWISATDEYVSGPFSRNS
jgi:CheY-like chemotaxis protein